jgi:peptide/nickel transport system permease protein
VTIVGVFVLRRLAVSFATLLAATFIVYVLVANAGDPHGDLRAEPSPNRDDKIRARIDDLNLDQSVPQRYVTWISGAATCIVPGGGCNLGKNIRSQDVTVLVSQALASTIRLVVVATVLAIVIGIAIGIVSALRQYSGLDYTSTFSAFLFYSLPVFAFAVLLKQYFAIRANDWLRDPRIGVATAIVLAAFSGLLWGALLGGDRRQRWIVRGVAAVVTFGLLMYLSAVEWFRRPSLGPVLIIVLSFGTAFGLAALLAGLRRRSVLYSALTMAGIASVGQFLVIPFLEDPTWSTWGTIALLAVVTVLVGAAVGWFLGGLDKGQAMRVAALTGLFCGGFMLLDILLRTVPSYSRMQRGRVFATVGSNTPNFDGDFWQRQLDLGAHLFLPTIAIMLISVASYSRYSRASMLEVMNQDYVRTARAKGLTERTVVVRHAFRNALIPVTTLAAIDFGALLGGAVITEAVFAWRGMGRLFVDGLIFVDPNPVMAFFIVTSVAYVVFNMLADIAYAYLDPRIRIS